MQTKIIKLDADKIDLAKIKEASSLLDDGGLVALPTETVYGIACRVKKDSLNKLNGLKGRRLDKFYTLHVGWPADVKKYVPTISLRAHKLIRNSWPGPLTIVFQLSPQDVRKQRSRLDKEVFKSLYKNNSIGIRCPDNSAALMLLQSTKNPVVAPSANITGQPPATDA
ncbi:MAG: L-threonylcarbamoyladenylate synthase, partial [Planctomycetota bacterium]